MDRRLDRLTVKLTKDVTVIGSIRKRI